LRTTPGSIPQLPRSLSSTTPSALVASVGGRAQAAETVDTKNWHDCTSTPWMTKAIAEGFGVATRLRFVPSFAGRHLVAAAPGGYAAMWGDLERCVKGLPSMSSGERESLYKQMVCHGTYANFGSAGPTFDFEAWRLNAPWTTVLDPRYECDRWGDVAKAGAEYVGRIVQSGDDTAAQKASWLVSPVGAGTKRLPIPTTKIYFCLTNRGTPPAVALSEEFLKEYLPVGAPLDDTVCASAPQPLPGLGGATVGLAQGPPASGGYRYAIRLSSFVPRSAVSVTCFDSVSPSGFYTFTMTTDGAGDASTESACFSGDGPDHWVVAGGTQSNHVSWGGSGVPPPPPPPAQTWSEQETPNHPVNTFLNYHNASGLGPAIAAGQWVEVACKVYDPTIGSVNPDGYWYRIASSPWSGSYYSPANTFMNGDPYGGPYTHNTDFAVPDC
jgi:hypothetical protein